MLQYCLLVVPLYHQLLLLVCTFRFNTWQHLIKINYQKTKMHYRSPQGNLGHATRANAASERRRALAVCKCRSGQSQQLLQTNNWLLSGHPVE